MRCLIDKSPVEPFHIFPRKAVFNKPVDKVLPQAVAEMSIAYNPVTRHISSALNAAFDVADLQRKVYEDLYCGYAPTELSATQKSYMGFVVQWINDHVPARSRVLEIGSHDGFLLHWLKQSGHDVQGIEPSSHAGHARDAYGVPVIRGFFKGDEFEPGSFDLLVMRHVVEHVDDPVAFLQAGARLLKPGGLAYIEVPNSLWCLEEFFFPEFHVDHVSYFTPASLDRLMNLASLSDIRHKEAYSAYMRFPFQCALGRKDAKPAGRPAPPGAYFSDFNAPRAIERFGKVHARYETNLCALEKRGSDAVTYVDVNPANQGKVLSVTGHRIESPEILKRVKPDILLIASGWEGDVREQARPFVSDRTQVLVFRDLI